MAAKQKSEKVEQPEVKAPVYGREPVVRQEVKSSFDERTQDIQPWQGTQGVDDTRPEPVIEKVKKQK